MRKNKPTAHELSILNADKDYQSAVGLFESARAKVAAANQVLNTTEVDIDAQIEELLAKKTTISEARERNTKFEEKLGEFLG